MALRVSLLIMISSAKLSRGSLVLPRPPSSPNEIGNNGNSLIDGGSKIFEGMKYYNEKSPRVRHHDRNHDRESNQRDNLGGNYHGSSISSTNVEKPNTDGYKLLEIELSGGKGVGRGGGGGGGGGGRRNGDNDETLNFGEILREVFKNDEERDKIRRKLSTNYGERNDKKFHGYAEKFYYLKRQGEIIAAKDSSDAIKKSRDMSPGKTIYSPKNYRLKGMLIINENDAESGRKNDNDNDGDYEDENRVKVLEMVDDYLDGYYPRGNYATAEFHTTENSLPTSSELPKQIPPPPSRLPSLTIFSHTTPVLRFMSRRSDILPGY